MTEPQQQQILIAANPNSSKFQRLRLSCATGQLHCTAELHSMIGYAGWSEAIMAFVRGGGYYLRSELAKLDVQTLLLWGRNDTFANPKFADKYQENIKQCQIVWLERCGHWASIEQPAETARLLLDFVSSGLPVRQ